MRIHTCAGNLPADMLALCSRKKAIVIRADMKYACGRPRPHNWGDDLNYHLVRAISGRRVVVQNVSFLDLLPVENYVCIGSVLEYKVNPQSVVWGTGVQYGIRPLAVRPRRITAVRGRLTHRFLTSQGIDCPATYGDPALLLPRFYRPDVRKAYRIGFVPHVCDLDNAGLRRYVETHADATIIDLAHYADWREVIDHICRCEVIVSSSLHGLIAADAYGVPNAWARFSDKVLGGDFKFLDYFSAVGRETEVVCIGDTVDMPALERALAAWRPIRYDDRPLFEVCPFRE